MFNKTESSFTYDQATIDAYVAKGRRERSQAFLTMIKWLFKAPERIRTTPAKTKYAA